MRQQDVITDARIRRVLRDYLQPAMVGPVAPLEVAAHQVDGEPEPAAQALAASYLPFAVGNEWGPAWSTTWFRLRGTVPVDWRGQEVALHFEIGSISNLGYAGDTGFGAEALIWEGGRPVQGLSPNHNRCVLTRNAQGGEAVELYVEAAANPHPAANLVTWPLLMPEPGGPALFTLSRAELVVRHPEVAALVHDMRILAELVQHIGDQEPRRSQVRAALNRSCNALDLEALADLARAGAKPHTRPDDRLARVAAARALLAPALSAPANTSTHRVSAVGHAHIDTAWLWPLRETVRKCARTFSTALALMDEYPEYHFACSQAQHYAWMKEHYPDIFTRIKAKVAAGQWHPVGSMWVEADTNIPAGESLVRQLLYGKRFFAEELGTDTEEVWLPDVFGYSGNLPQLMHQAGVRWFLTQKLSWNQYNAWPHHSFVWEGVDGSRVFAHFPPADTYNGQMSIADLTHAVANFRDHDTATLSLYPFGYGDGGGGPTAEMLEAGRRLADLEGAPRVRQEAPAAFFAQAEAEMADPAVWVGELYFEKHRGTYTTQAAAKAGNRRGELALAEAELWAALAPAPYPARRLERAWKRLLVNQFHDIIPGSAIHWVYQQATADHAEVAAEAEAIREISLSCLLPQMPTHGLCTPVVALNPLSHDRIGLASLPPGVSGAAVEATGGGLGPVQMGADGTALFTARVPSCGYATYDVVDDGPVPVATSTPDPELAVGEHHLESSRLGVALDDHGLLTSVWDKRAGREVLAPGTRGNLFQLHPDYPNEYDAWDVDRFYLEQVSDLEGLDSLEVVERGPLRVALRLVRTFGQSRVTQVISLDAGSGRLDFATEVDWHESHRFLKVAFPVDVRSARATYEIQFGHVERPTHANTSWDVARFEVCAHTWADLSEPGYGVALLNDCKYGYDIRGNVMRLSLLRAPTWPDPVADRGHHRFTYALLPHAGDLREAGVIEQASDLNSPLRTVAAGRHDGRGPRDASFVRLDRAGVVVAAVKQAEDGDDLVIRVYEAWGRRCSVGMELGFPVARAWRTDLLEWPTSAVPVEGDHLRLELSPFEIVTLRLEVPRP
ncbi:MAG: alpha-mannosidase [Acidimicrobiales bacterium]|nr:MAG: alpha-mannosidase [Acidimicrobiales bacterium]